MSPLYVSRQGTKQSGGERFSVKTCWNCWTSHLAGGRELISNRNSFIVPAKEGQTERVVEYLLVWEWRRVYCVTGAGESLTFMNTPLGVFHTRTHTLQLYLKQFVCSLFFSQWPWQEYKKDPNKSVCIHCSRNLDQTVLASADQMSINIQFLITFLDSDVFRTVF